MDLTQKRKIMKTKTLALVQDKLEYFIQIVRRSFTLKIFLQNCVYVSRILLANILKYFHKIVFMYLEYS